VLIVKVVEAATPAAREFPQVSAVFVAVLGLYSSLHGVGGLREIMLTSNAVKYYGEVTH
jgi:hypothetical protein